MKRAILVVKNGIINFSLSGDYYGADKGALQVIRAKLPLVGAIGDFDSVSESEFQEIKKNAKMMIKLNPVKDESDTAEAIRYLEEQHYDEIIVVGGLDGRFDHTLANLQNLLRSKRVIWMDSQNRLQLLEAGEHSIKKGEYPYISFFAINQGKITLKAMKYPLNQYNLTTLDSLCLSNEILDEEGIVVCTMPVLCIQSKD